MSGVVVRCRQCGWEGVLPRERIPLYGARVRCGACGALQGVAPAEDLPEHAEEATRSTPAAGTGPRPRAPLPAEPAGPAGSEGGADGSWAGRGDARGGAPPLAEETGAGLRAPAAAIAGRPERGDQAGPPVLHPTEVEIRQVLGLWLQELRRGSRAPLTRTRVFREHGEDLAHLLSLWEASFPGDAARELFRARLLEALDEMPTDAAEGSAP